MEQDSAPNEQERDAQLARDLAALTGSLRSESHGTSSSTPSTSNMDYDQDLAFQILANPFIRLTPREQDAMARRARGVGDAGLQIGGPNIEEGRARLGLAQAEDAAAAAVEPEDIQIEPNTPGFFARMRNRIGAVRMPNWGSRRTTTTASSVISGSGSTRPSSSSSSSPQPVGPIIAPVVPLAISGGEPDDSDPIPYRISGRPRAGLARVAPIAPPVTGEPAELTLDDDEEAEAVPTVDSEPVVREPGRARRWGRNIMSMARRAARRVVPSSSTTSTEPSLRERVGARITRVTEVARAIPARLAPLGEAIRRGPERVREWMNDLHERFEEKRATPAGKATEAAAKAALIEAAKLFKKTEGGKPLDKKTALLAIAKVLGTWGITYGKEKAIEVTKAAGTYTKDHWKELTQSAIFGAGLRTVFVAAGAEVYLAAAGAAAIVGGAREADRIISENETEKPETILARLDLRKRYLSIPEEKRKELQLGRKVGTAAVFSAAGAVIGAGIVEATGVGEWMHNSAKSLWEMIPSEINVMPPITDTPTTPSFPPSSEIPSIVTPEIATPPDVPSIPSEAIPPAVPNIIEPATTIPEIPVQTAPIAPTIDTPPAIPETVPPVAVPEVVAPIDVLPNTMELLPNSGQSPWTKAEELLHMADPNRIFTPGEIMEVDIALCKANTIAVPEWADYGLKGGPGWTAAGDLGKTGPFEFKITDSVKGAVTSIINK